MESRTLQYVAAACGGELRGGSPTLSVAAVSTDSRTLAAGALFVPLAGERFDGHDYLAAAAARGAAATLVARDRLDRVPAGLPAIVVEDPKRAFAELAAFYRREFDLPVVCVGGSNGKTTAKEFIAAALSKAGPVLKSPFSFNNDVGVPTTLLQLEARHRFAVLEAGSNHPNELAPLVRLIAPQIGVITSIGREHLEFFGDLDGVIREEGWLAELLPPAEHGGVLVMNGDGPWREAMELRTSARIVRVNSPLPAAWSAVVQAMDWSGTAFSVKAPDPRWNGDYSIVLPGRHSVGNALLALAVAAALGVSPTAARAGLAQFQPPPQRLNVRAAGGVQILDDTYNANPDSMRAALQTLSNLPCAGRRVAVLGDMAELGPHAETAHAEVGRFCQEAGLDAVYAVGRRASITASAAGQGLDHAFARLSDASTVILRNLRPGDAVLIKGSRSSEMERLVDALLKQLELRERTGALEIA